MSDAYVLPALNEMPLPQVARTLGCELDARWEDRRFGQVATDSRAIKPGDIFLALRGEKFDGHKFCQAAVERGAAALIVEQGSAESIPGETAPVLRVGNTLEAYGRLAHDRRMRWAGPVIAISGSVGKTTTRRLIASALGRGAKVLEPLRNFNNLIGVPHTLLRLGQEHEIAVLELGMNLPGELTELTRIAMPSAAVLTRIADSHVGMFESFEKLIEAKLDLFRNCPAGTPLAINAACPHTRNALPEFDTMHPIIRFEAVTGPVDTRLRDVLVDNIEPAEPFGYRFDLTAQGQRFEGCELRHFGRHQLENVAAAAAGLMAMDEPVEWLVEALAEFKSEPLRGEFVETGGMTLILDCYNASPVAMRSALTTLLETPCAGRRIVVLADMLELGARAESAHRELEPILMKIAPAMFFGLGSHCSALAGRLGAAGMNALGFERRDDMVEALGSAVRPGDQIFFKGSHGFGLENAAEAISSWRRD